MVSKCGSLCKIDHGHTLMDVRKDTTLSDGHMPKQLIQLLVVANGQLKMAGNDTRLLVVTGSVASQFEDFSGEVFQNSGEIDGST